MAGIHGRKISRQQIDVGALMLSMDHLRWDHPIVMKAFRVSRELQKWLDGMYDPEKVPAVFCTVSEATVSISVGDVPVWDNQVFNEDQLTFDHCKAELFDHAKLLITPFE